MDGFSASYLEIEPRELVRYLLRETRQNCHLMPNIPLAAPHRVR